MICTGKRVVSESELSVGGPQCRQTVAKCIMHGGLVEPTHASSVLRLHTSVSGSLLRANAGSPQHLAGGVQRGAAGGRRQLQRRPTAGRLVWQRPAPPVCRAGWRPCRGACLLVGGQGGFVRAALCCGRTACAGGRRRAAHEQVRCPATTARVLHGLRRALAGQGPRAARVCASHPAAPAVAAGLRGVLTAQRDACRYFQVPARLLKPAESAEVRW